ncbi:hypothetical protein C9J12_29565 [Photobacterium frigidiphilum]|uniref:Uncharacterized protein n=1 Tax=Photobacterium frigidiphilum TaxID=264736 RepID=A0A2T3J5T3_9GAMM|nr:hypothetical protein C9J12_29565 [Photobacterium frigidiphilum]
MEVVTSNISCTTANSPSSPYFIPKLRSKTCQLDVFLMFQSLDESKDALKNLALTVTSSKSQKRLIIQAKNKAL